jgi:NAD(P)-dependent dehydrogenase (short-subunit alcohol dehydrogenase family)
MKITEARAVVTGGASGLGNAVARYICSNGGRVAMLDVQDGPGQAAAAELGAAASFIKCDVTSEAEVVAAMESARQRLGGINLLVNCAGVVGAGRMLGKNGPMAGDFFTKVIHINLIGTFLCDKAAAATLPSCRRTRRMRMGSAACSFTPLPSRPLRGRSARSRIPRRKPLSWE